MKVQTRFDLWIFYSRLIFYLGDWLSKRRIPSTLEHKPFCNWLFSLNILASLNYILEICVEVFTFYLKRMLISVNLFCFCFRILDNNEWYKEQRVIDFLSETGRYFRMGTMLSRHRYAFSHLCTCSQFVRGAWFSICGGDAWEMCRGLNPARTLAGHLSHRSHWDQ